MKEIREGFHGCGRSGRILLCWLVATFVSVFNAAGYSVTQPRSTWACGDVFMELHLGSPSPPRVLWDGRTSWDAVAEDAMVVWNANLATIRLRPRYGAGSCADLDGRNGICWTSPAEEPGLEDAVAITWRWRSRTTSETLEADILVNNTEQWESYRGPRCDPFIRCVAEYDLRRVLLHEMGHVIGLAHEDDVPSVMATHISNVDTLTADDIAGGTNLYPRDAFRPLITVSSPTNGTRYTTVPITVRGTAADNCLISHLLYQLNTNSSIAFTGTAARAISWSIPVLPRPGSNTLRVWSVDTSTNRSLPAQSTFFYSLRAPLTIEIEGAGSTTISNGSRLEIGRGYEVTAAPAAGNLFRGWRDENGGLISAKAKLVFMMQSNLLFKAEFMTNPFPLVAGTYNGLFYGSNGVTAGSSGFLRLTLTGQGTYSAVMRSFGKTNSFTGKFDPVTGQSHATVLRGQTAVTLDLQLDLTGSSDLLVGRITTATWESFLDAPRFGFNATRPATNFVGRYTLILYPDNDLEPLGYGFGTATVDLAGRLAITGKLPDGTPFSHAASLSASGAWPFYAHLYSGKGLIIDWVYFVAPFALADSRGTWIRPAISGARYYPGGFTNVLVVSGSPYSYLHGTPILNTPNAAVILTGGNLVEPATNYVVLGTNGQFVTTNGLKLKVNTTNGSLSGSVTVPPNSRTISIAGAVLQNATNGWGYFLDTNRAGRVLIEPVP